MPKCKETLPAAGLPEIPTCGATHDPEGDRIICAVFLGSPCFLGIEGVEIREQPVIVTENGRKRVRRRQIPMLSEEVKPEGSV